MTGTKSIAVLLYIAVLLLGIPQVFAQQKPHEQFSPQLQQAVAAWLNDDDHTALPLLAKLAQNGNENAMLLLAQIDLRPGSVSPFLASLNRSEMKDLFRAKGGIFGRSWFTVVKEQQELAQALNEATKQQSRLQASRKLLGLGETGIAILTIAKEVSFQRYDQFLKLFKNQDVPEEVRFYQWSAAFATQMKDTKRRLALLDAAQVSLVRQELQGYLFIYLSEYRLRHPEQLAWPRLMGRFMFAGAPAFTAIAAVERSKVIASAANQIERSNALKPLTTLCKTQCPGSVKACATTLFSAIGGYNIFIQLQSPLEKIIPKKAYFKSRRFGADVMRNIPPDFIKLALPLIPEADADACIIGAIAKNQAK